MLILTVVVEKRLSRGTQVGQTYADIQSCTVGESVTASPKTHFFQLWYEVNCWQSMKIECVLHQS